MKARIKTIVLSALSAMAVFTAVTYTSCKSDKCKSIVCAYGGVCTDGGCLCPTGYEGPQCETITRDRYLNTWVVTENGSITDAVQYSVSVEKGPAIDELLVKNFYNHLIEQVSARVKGDTLYVPQQVVDHFTVIGHGYITDEKYYGKNGRIVLYYKVTDNLNGQTDDFGIDSGDPSLWNK